MKNITIIAISLLIGFFSAKIYYSKPIDLTKDIKCEEKIILEETVPWMKEAHGGLIKNLAVYASKSGNDAIIIDILKENIVSFLTLDDKGIVKIDITDEQNNFLTLSYEEDGTFKDINFTYNKGKVKYIDKNADGIYDFKIKNGKDYFNLVNTEWSSIEE